MNKKNSGVQAQFTNPPNAYRGKPFWAWNGKLDEAELRRQLGVMKQMGMGGAFMHSRTGLATEYLSDEWFRLVNACEDECEKNGMEAWLYDEDRWPSGAAGGIVTRNPKYRLKILHVEACRRAEYQHSKEHLAVYAAEINGDELLSYRRVSGGGIKSVTEDRIIFCHARPQEPSSWYNGQTYLDTLSEEAVEAFIKVTHKAYRAKCGEHFGKHMPGIFTDEPNYGGVHVVNGVALLPWTEKLPRAFKSECGYDLLDVLPELVFRFAGEDFSKARHDYYETITRLFDRAFGKKIFDFCEKAGLLYTGHALCEETLPIQTKYTGSAMRFYEYLHAPGIDILCGEGLEREGGRPPELLTAKQCASVRNQMGRKWMLSELYGCTGWHFTFAEHKAVGDWQAAMGVNLRCHHLAWYTMKGEAKRDYPASIFFQSPFWKDYGLVEDYFARLGVMLTQGRPVSDIGVIHPIESGWGIAYQNLADNPSGGFPQTDSKEKRSPFVLLDEKLATLQNILLYGHHDFEYIDEDILARHGSVAKGRLKVGRSSYGVLIVPPLETIRSGTAKALAKFAGGGGKLLVVDSLPKRMDAAASGEIPALFSGAEVVRLDQEAITGILDAQESVRRVSIKGDDGREFEKALCTMRSDAKLGTVVFVCATFQNGPCAGLTIDIPAKGQVQEWHPLTGDISLADYETVVGGVRVRTSLDGCGSRLFVVAPTPRRGLRRPASSREAARLEFPSDDFSIQRDEPNAFPLDCAEFAIGDEEFRPRMEILKIDTLVRERAGWGRQGGAMAQPWTRKGAKRPRTLPVRLRYRFLVERLPISPSSLVMESPERYVIKWNGIDIRRDGGEGWWIDPSFQRLAVPPHALKTGENVLELAIDYQEDDALEALYFTGEFGVEWRKTPADGSPVAVVRELPGSLKIGDWCEQGFPAYTGSIAYHSEIEIADLKGRFFLSVPEWAGSLLKIHVNGVLAGRIGWKPFEVEIGEYLQQGRNRIAIEVVGTRRNILGPLHMNLKHPIGTGPYSFRDPDYWTDDYTRLPYGLFAKPFVSRREV